MADGDIYTIVNYPSHLTGHIACNFDGDIIAKQTCCNIGGKCDSAAPLKITVTGGDAYGAAFVGEYEFDPTIFLDPNSGLDPLAGDPLYDTKDCTQIAIRWYIDGDYSGRYIRLYLEKPNQHFSNTTGFPEAFIQVELHPVSDFPGVGVHRLTIPFSSETLPGSPPPVGHWIPWDCGEVRTLDGPLGGILGCTVTVGAA